MNKSTPTSDQSDAVVIKKYANRRLYNTETSTYVTLEDLAQMVRSDRDFVVRDAKTGDDLTHAVLTQIIVEQESRAGGPTLLPIPFLRQLIRYYDDSVGKLVPGYLQFSLETLTKEQERFRAQLIGNPWGTGAFEAYQDQARRNLAIFEKAMAMWVPFNPGVQGGAAAPEADLKPDASVAPEAAGQPSGTPANGIDTKTRSPSPHQAASHSAPVDEMKAREDKDKAPQPSANPEIDLLKQELAAMQKRIENLSRPRED